ERLVVEVIRSGIVRGRRPNLGPFFEFPHGPDAPLDVVRCQPDIRLSACPPQSNRYGGGAVDSSRPFASKRGRAGRSCEVMRTRGSWVSEPRQTSPGLRWRAR